STLLRGLKEYTANLAAIVTVADDGGSSGRLREEYRILPPGDFRQCLVALADAEPLVKELFNHRFSEGSLGGHSFGNLFIMAMADITGNFEHALRESGRVLAVRGAIIPSTLHDVTLVASVNGASQHGETDNFNVSDYLRVLADHVEQLPLDFIVFNSNLNHMPTGGQSQVIFDFQEAQRMEPRARFIAADVVNTRIPSHHDPEKLSKVLIKRVWEA